MNKGKLVNDLNVARRYDLAKFYDEAPRLPKAGRLKQPHPAVGTVLGKLTVKGYCMPLMPSSTGWIRLKAIVECSCEPGVEYWAEVTSLRKSRSCLKCSRKKLVEDKT